MNRSPLETVRAISTDLPTGGDEYAPAVRAVMRLLVNRIATGRGLSAPWDVDLSDDVRARVAKHIDGLGGLEAWGVVDLGGAFELLMNPDGRKLGGSYYTPPEVADFMVRFSIGPQLDQLAQDPDPGNLLQICAIDPACGAGVFLVSQRAPEMGDLRSELAEIQARLNRVVALLDPVNSVYCGVRLVECNGRWSHVSATPCREARPCDLAERGLRWDDWRREPPLARSAGRGEAAHVLVYGTTDSALCGRQVDVPVPTSSGLPGCRQCLNWHSSIDYGWRCEQSWREPYGGTHIVPMVELMGLRPTPAIEEAQ